MAYSRLFRADDICEDSECAHLRSAHDERADLCWISGCLCDGFLELGETDDDRHDDPSRLDDAC